MQRTSCFILTLNHKDFHKLLTNYLTTNLIPSRVRYLEQWDDNEDYKRLLSLCAKASKPVPAVIFAGILTVSSGSHITLLGSTFG